MANLLGKIFAVCGFVSLITVSFATVGTDCSTDAGVCDGTTEICDTTCKCAPGYSDPDGNNACTDINECTAGTANCHADATCTNAPPGSVTCTCNAGYSGDGGTCTVILGSACPIGTECATVTNAGCDAGTTQCTCNTGYEVSVAVCANIDECATDTNCQNGGTCVDSIGSYTCACAPGWEGTDCNTDIDECTVDTPCDNGGTCTDTDGSYSCACTDAWAGMDCDRESLGACTDTTCPSGVTNGECVDSKCVCQDGFKKDGENCVGNASVSINKMSQSLLLVVCLMAFVFKRC